MAVKDKPADDHQERLEVAAQKSANRAELTEADVMLALPTIIKKVGQSRRLEAIISDKLRGEEMFDQRRALKSIVQRRINASDTTSGGEMLARAVIRQLRFHFDNDIEGVLTETKADIVDELAQNVARALLVAAGIMLGYSGKLRALEIAKDDRDARNIAKNRTEALLTEEDFKKSLMNVGRACTGDDQPIEERL